ncbi:MAG TPA: NUDIX domain-containing protein [Verrucomicrobiae bacterium]|nr:NUDIX domain-containing protein [Verrucomicrobiae bacterium]
MHVVRNKTSAGLLMFRVQNGSLEVFLAHPGGPFFACKDEGHWTIPKGEIEPGEDMLAAAVREFAEEIGIEPRGEYLELGSVRQNRTKTVHGWAFEGDWQADQLVRSNQFEMEWPPLSGKRQSFPEVDQAAFFSPDAARRKIKPTQTPFIDRLEAALQSRRALSGLR